MVKKRIKNSWTKRKH